MESFGQPDLHALFTSTLVPPDEAKALDVQGDGPVTITDRPETQDEIFDVSAIKPLLEEAHKNSLVDELLRTTNDDLDRQADTEAPA